MKLHSFFNSSTSYRVRIALAIKGLPYEYVPVDIRKLAHRTPEFIDLNPSANVPLLEDGEVRLGQSLAIIDYLDAAYPGVKLIPADPALRARVLEVSYAISCDIHPVNNLRILRYLVNDLGVSDEAKNGWYAHWIAEGLAAVERLLERHGSGPYCFGEAPSLADCCLVPQVANAMRMKCDVSAFPRVMAVYRHCEGQPAFQKAAPSAQPDYA
ncbi:maleylacetoacetate isomerase [Achromobacter sp. GG226]|uniref:maleylacetoacetate isomerase n=1 Tax=Verticiella alkaliphila TaxID=2779529 RepID=UPI001C0D5530|nr:maleylacetoacetate isomerase [Verticiella sp. GG226]MBU4610887.1 maleylacetoacetate isomerase [Verticiella sp. GG226]